MSDYPYKVGDLVEIKTSQYNAPNHVIKGVITGMKVKDIFFEVLVEGQLRIVHRNYLVTPKIKAVKMTGGIK